MLHFSLALGLALASPLVHEPPPHLPADHGVPFGCVPDAFVYVNQLARVRPELAAQTLDLEVRHSNGIRESHTVVIVRALTGTLWLRDIHFGVIPLPRHPAPLPSVAAQVLAQHVEVIASRNPRSLPKRSLARTPAERRAANRAVQQMIPDAELLQLEEETFTTWRRGDEYYVYHPARGTARASTAQTAPDRAVFAAIARRLHATKTLAAMR